MPIAQTKTFILTASLTTYEGFCGVMLAHSVDIQQYDSLLAASEVPVTIAVVPPDDNGE